MAGVRQFDEEQALGRALDVFGVRGFRDTSMLDLAAGTGVHRGSLYHAYGGKEEIFLKVFAEHTAGFLAGAAQALAQPDKRTAMLAFFDFCIDTITAGEPSRGCLSTRTAIDAGVDSPRVRAAVRDMLDRLETVVRDALSNIDDDIPPRVEAAAAARLVVAVTRGVAVLERVEHTPNELRAIAATLTTAVLGH
jgi:AcrR family transcriptional regulator